MTAAVKHMARKKPGTAGVAAPAQPRNRQLRERFPARPAQPWWPCTAEGEEDTLRRLTSPPFLPEIKATRAGRRRGTAKMLRWLSSFPGDTWQQRWEASGAEEHPGSSWLQLPLDWLRGNGLAASYDANDLSSGLLMLICGDVIRPGLAWMVTRAHKHLAPVMAEVRDPGGFARLRELAESGPLSSLKDARLAATRIATVLACKGGVISDITVGDCVEMADTQRLVHSRGGQKKAGFYLRLRALGTFPADAPATIRANLHDRIAEAEREGWLGEIEGLKVSLAGTEDKLAQIDATLRRKADAVQLGMPAFPGIAGRSVTTTPAPKDTPCPASTTTTPASLSRPSPMQPDI